MNMVVKVDDAVEVESAPRARPPFEVSTATQEVLALAEMMPEEGHGQQALGHLPGALVQERDALVRDRIGILRKAQDTVRSEMERLARVQPLDREALRQLGVSVHGFATRRRS